MAHWIKPKKEGIINYGPGYVECSDCHKKVYLATKYAFCPFCGRKITNVISEKTNWLTLAERLPAE